HPAQQWLFISSQVSRIQPAAQSTAEAIGGRGRLPTWGRGRASSMDRRRWLMLLLLLKLLALYQVEAFDLESTESTSEATATSTASTQEMLHKRLNRSLLMLQETQPRHWQMLQRLNRSLDCATSSRSRNSVFRITARSNCTLLLAPRYEPLRELASPLELLNATLDIALTNNLVRSLPVRLKKRSHELGCDFSDSMRRIIKLNCPPSSDKQARVIVGPLCSYAVNNVFLWFRLKSDALITAGANSVSFDEAQYSELIRIGTTAEHDMNALLAAFRQIPASAGLSPWRRMLFVYQDIMRPLASMSKPRKEPWYYVDNIQCKNVFNALKYHFKGRQDYIFESFGVNSNVKEDKKQSSQEKDAIFNNILLSKVGNRLSLSKREQFRLLCLLPQDSPYQFDHSLVAPSTDLVMDSLTARGLNKHFSLNISFENSTCSNRAALPAMEYYYSGRVDGFLGLACPESCSQVVQYSGSGVETSGSQHWMQV
uniref:Guanylate cyclase n=1 Tax=Macrostomum lignano TaxID=282301 RepID=A0A1I8F652_9PLAT